MTNEAIKIITWALKSVDAYGSHIVDLNSAINSGRVSESVKIELLEVLDGWVGEENKRISA